MNPSPGAPERWRWVGHSPDHPPVAPTQPPRPRYLYGPAFSERTPSYSATPRWGLPAEVRIDSVAPTRRRDWTKSAAEQADFAVTWVYWLSLGASLAHLVRYGVLAVYADRLAPQWLEWVSVGVVFLLGIAALLWGLLAALLVTAWLVIRRREAFAPMSDPRGLPQLWLSCLVPLVNVVRPPVLLRELELAVPAARSRGSARRITRWWSAWVVNLLLVAAVLWRSSAEGPQAEADTVVLSSLAYFASAWVAWEVRGVMSCFANTHPGFTRRLLLRGMVSAESSTKEG